MFILREIDKNGLETNTCIDVYYTLVLKQKNKEEFNSLTELWAKEDLEDVYGLVSVGDVDLMMPLYSGSSYYIMTSDGKTFSNISEK